MERLPVKRIEGVDVAKGKYYCIGFVYKDNLLKAILINKEGEIFPTDYHKVLIDRDGWEG